MHHNRYDLHAAAQLLAGLGCLQIELLLAGFHFRMFLAGFGMPFIRSTAVQLLRLESAHRRSEQDAQGKCAYRSFHRMGFGAWNRRHEAVRYMPKIHPAQVSALSAFSSGQPRLSNGGFTKEKAETLYQCGFQPYIGLTLRVSGCGTLRLFIQYCTRVFRMIPATMSAMPARTIQLTVSLNRNQPKNRL